MWLGVLGTAGEEVRQEVRQEPRRVGAELG
jgi:hypothetical protein